MELDRNNIERSDFPPARRGYEPDAVDRHLSEVAAAVEDLEEQLRQAKERADQLRQAKERDRPTMAGAAAEQVRMIVEAAELSAAEIEGRAQADFDKSAREAAERTRSLHERLEAETDARIRRVDGVAEDILARAATFDSELSRMHDDLRAADSLLGALRSRSEPLREEIAGMRSGLADVRDSAAEAPSGGPATVSMPSDPPPQAEETHPRRDAPAAPLDSEPEQDVELDRELELERDEEVVALGDGDESHADEPPPPRAAEEEVVPVATEERLPDEDDEDHEDDDEFDESLDGAVVEDDVTPEPSPRASDEGARLVALNMALNGTPREETDRYLADNFDLADRGSMLDEVYARLGRS